MAIPVRILRQARDIRNNWGDQAARNYLSRYDCQYQQQSLALERRDRWLSNDKHQPRRYSDLAAAMIEVRSQAGQTCRGLAERYGCSQGTISSIRRHHGAYRTRNRTE